LRDDCLPKSGGVFRVGRMTVNCATARFAITVKRVR
jgi:hypothetical protein